MRSQSDFFLRIVVNAIALLGLATPALAQRLPGNVTPSHYDIALEPNLANATFAGTERITVKLERPAKTITLNAAEITFDSVTVSRAAAARPRRCRSIRRGSRRRSP